MKPWLYVGMMVALVPVQATIWRYVSVAGIRPDLCLVATCLVGILGAETEAVLVGLGLGFLQDLFSPGEAWLNMLTKGTIGLLASVAGRHLARSTPTAIFVLVLSLSAASSLAFLFVGWPPLAARDSLLAVTSILIPQALFDAALAAGVLWLLNQRRRTESGLRQGALGFGS